MMLYGRKPWIKARDRVGDLPNRRLRGRTRSLNNLRISCQRYCDGDVAWAREVGHVSLSRKEIQVSLG
jgi:hypothetical protein